MLAVFNRAHLAFWLLWISFLLTQAPLVLAVFDQASLILAVVDLVLAIFGRAPFVANSCWLRLWWIQCISPLIQLNFNWIRVATSLLQCGLLFAASLALLAAGIMSRFKFQNLKSLQL